MVVAFENPENLFQVIKGLVYEGIPFKVKKIEEKEYISAVRTYWVLETDYEINERKEV